MLFFYPGHRQQVGFELFHAQRSGVGCGDLVFDHVPAFKPSSEIHREKPADHMTRRADRSPYHPQLRLT